MEININLTIPESWNDLTDHQMRSLGRAYRHKGDRFDYSVFYILTHKRNYSRKYKKQLQIVIDMTPISELKKFYRWFYEDVNREVFISLIGFVKPMDRIFNLSIEEFAVADDLNNRFLETGDFNFLQHLCAAIYLKKNERFDILLQNKRAERMKRITPEELFAVHICWNGCKAHLMKKFPKVFPNVKKAMDNNRNKGKGFLDVVLQMSGQKFGTHNETKRTPVHTFLEEFQNTIIQQEKWKEQSTIKR